MKTKQVFTLSIILISTNLFGFSQNSNLYMPKEIKQAYEKGTRSWDGNPGTNYWQNFSEYKIDVEFIPDSCYIIGHETIKYQNNSPDTLKSITLMIKQNLFMKGGMRDFPIPLKNVTDGAQIRSILIDGDSIDFKNPRETRSMGTTLLFRLDSTSQLLPSSETTVEINWQQSMPKQYLIRSGGVGDSAFFISYWFPQIVVYDDIYGWNNMFYTGITETYNDISNFDIKIKVPGDFLVWATGTHQNPEEIYIESFNSKINKSKQNNESTHLLTEEDLKEPAFLKVSENHIWHFKAQKVPDFSFALANKYVWDAVSVVSNKKTGKRTWVNVVYSPNTEQYKQVIDFAGKSIQYFSDELPGIPFPYEKHTTFQIEGTGGGMEFPMMAANGLRDTVALSYLTAHEIAHTWFPFYVNTNEERYAWMDEGWVTLFGQRYNDYAGLGWAKFWAPRRRAWNTENDIPLMVASNNLSFYAMTHYYYEKSTTANKVLFEIFEDKGIHNPLRTFMLRWKYKHPTPYDYFFTMEDILGEDLSWFWKPWYFEFHAPDLKIEKLTQKKQEAEIIVSNPGEMPVPVCLTIEFEDETTEKIRKTAYVWKDNPELFIVKLETKKTIKKITLGNEDLIDVQPEDNEWKVTSNK